MVGISEENDNINVPIPNIFYLTEIENLRSIEWKKGKKFKNKLSYEKANSCGS